MRAAGWFVILALGASPLGVAAQARDATAAEVMFNAARAAADRGDHREACEKFRESHRLDPAAGTLLNIGDCAERTEQLALAWRSYSEALQLLPTEDRRTAFAKSKLAEVEARVPWLTVRLAEGTPDDAQVIRDGVALGRAAFGVPFPVDPGRLALTVRADGREDKLYTLTLEVGARREETLEVGPPTPPSAVARPPASRPAPVAPDPKPTAPSKERGTTSSGGTRTLGIVLAGIGVAGFATSGVAAAMILREKSAVEDECNADRRCTSAGLDAASTGRTLDVVGTAAFAVGVVGVGLGAYFVFGSDGPARTTVGTAPSRDGGRLFVSRTF